MRRQLIALGTALILVSFTACGDTEPQSSAPVGSLETTSMTTSTATAQSTSRTTTSDTTSTAILTSTSSTTTTHTTRATTTTKTPSATTTTEKPPRETLMTDYQCNDYTACITYRTPLTNTYNKLTKDKELTVVYFGGSLTNGYGCTDREKYSWRGRSGTWLREQFPDANITTINTAIGESGTYLGTYRVQKDVIGSKPDLLFIEYAINDTYSGASGTVAGLRFETIVREVRQALPYCDIVTIITTDRTFAANSNNLLLYPTAIGHSGVAAAYDLPVVNIGAGLVRNIAKTEGNNWWGDNAVWSTYFKDNVHPYDNGHEQYFLCLREYLENSLLHTDYTGQASVKRTLPNMLSEHLLDGDRRSITGDALQSCVVTADSVNAVYCADAFTTSVPQTPYNGYFRIEKGGHITLAFEGTELAIWTNLTAPAKLTYAIDGGEAKTVSFDDHNPTPIASGLSVGKHTITLSANSAMKLGALFTRDETKQTVK